MQLAQLVESWIVVPVVMGSSPILHPKRKQESGWAPVFFSGAMPRRGRGCTSFPRGFAAAPRGDGGKVPPARHAASPFCRRSAPPKYAAAHHVTPTPNPSPRGRGLVAQLTLRSELRRPPSVSLTASEFGLSCFVITLLSGCYAKPPLCFRLGVFSQIAKYQQYTDHAP